MGRINTNTSALIAQSNLAQNNADLNVRLERLSTGLRINRGRDDPAGLIISERIRTDIEGAEAGIKNAERASAVIATTEASLAEVNDLLNSIKALLVESANTGASSKEEREANQLQIDSAIASITRIANTSTFGGLKLLNGELGYTTSGIATSAIAKAEVFSASFIGQTSLQADVEVLDSAQTASVFLSGFNAGGTAGAFTSTTSIRFAGTQGVATLEFTSGQTLSAAVAAVNNLTSITGVSASLVSATDQSSGVVFSSTEYGSDAFVSVERIGGPSDPADSAFATFKLDDAAALPANIWGGTLSSASRDEGRDVTALINGTLANGDGLEVSIASPILNVKLELSADFGTQVTGTLSAFNITGGGALFQLGPEVTALQQTNIGIGSVAAENLGGVAVNGTLEFLASVRTGQDNDIRNSVSRGDFSTADAILDSAIDEISILRGRLGAFERNTLDTNVRSLQASVENLTASASVIRDADFAVETSELTRAQILSSASTSALALANQQAQQALQLLG